MEKYELPKDTPRNEFTETFEYNQRLGLNVNIIVVGKRPGIGKTYGAARIAEMLDPGGFGPKEVEEGRYCFYAKNYMNVVKETEPYRFVLFDEPGRKGSGGAKHEWQTEVNKALLSTVQVQRFMMPNSIFIVPHRAFISGPLFGLAQVMMVFEDRGYAKCYRIRVSEFDGNIYTDSWLGIHLQRPDTKLVHAMEAKKREMWDADMAKWIKEVDRMGQMKTTAADLAEKIVQEGLVESLSDEKGLSLTKISRFAHCGVTKARDIRNMIPLSSDTQ